MSKQFKISEHSADAILKQFEDPIRMMIIIEIIRKPNLTSNELKKKLLISGTKIYYYLNQLSSSEPPIIYESEKEQVSQHLVRRKFKITDMMTEIFNKYFNPNEDSKRIRLYFHYLSIAILHQQVRETKKIQTPQDLQNTTRPLISFVDQEIAAELREEVSAIFARCSLKYANLDRLSALRACEFGAISGVYPMN